MAIATEGQKEHLRARVRDAYSRAADRPADKHPFPVGRDFAESVGYPPSLLDTLPRVSSERFAGVSNVSIFADIPPGSRVADVGCGAGLDTMVAAKRSGSGGMVLGVDFSASMVRAAVEAAEELGLSNVAFATAAAEHLPVKTASLDVVLVNGIFNLNPHRDLIFPELARVLKKGGRLFAAELVLAVDAPPTELLENDWFA